LVIACGAIGIKPGDEVIVTPFSMTCSATAPMVWGGVPVFADIEPDHFCLDPEDVRRKITNKTKAIIVVDLFGQPHNWDAINRIAKEHRLYIIEDAAQAPGAFYKGRSTGTLGDIGVFSFNGGKHIASGEGGMMVVQNDLLAMKCQLLMNHAEAVVNDMESSGSPKELHGLFGFNLRLTEIQAAIISSQLIRFPETLRKRQENVTYLQAMIEELPCFSIPELREGATHSYYVMPLKYNASDELPSRTFVNAVRAELKPCAGKEWDGVPIGAGYIKPIWRMPLFHGDDGRDSLTPVCDKLYNDELIIVHRLFGPNADKRSLDDVAEAFHKVWKNRGKL
jgi:dTDP-4-amino-4,6-dideoxygalactose transaminase